MCRNCHIMYTSQWCQCVTSHTLHWSPLCHVMYTPQCYTAPKNSMITYLKNLFQPLSYTLLANLPDTPTNSSKTLKAQLSNYHIQIGFTRTPINETAVNTKKYTTTCRWCNTDQPPTCKLHSPTTRTAYTLLHTRVYKSPSHISREVIFVNL